jgi:ABC-type sugar transport system ATPase subunit
VQIRDLDKSYGGVHALRHVNLTMEEAEVHGLCGENGAGKSTLIRCVTGVVVPDSGSVSIAGRSPRFGSVRSAEAIGIAVMHQESIAFPDLNAIDNIFVGREPRRLAGLWLDRRRMRLEATRLLDRLQQRLDLDVPLRELSLAERQMVAMARALAQQCRLLIMDEPTASLSARETENLLETVGLLRQQGVAILYVSHRLDEIFTLADRVTVLRDGQHVVTKNVGDISKSDLIHWMVGRELEQTTVRDVNPAGPLVMEVRDLQVQQTARVGKQPGFNLKLHAGEVVGLSGLVGAGRSEIVRAIFGIDRRVAGEVLVHGELVAPNSVRAAVHHGVVLVPEDRQHQGLVLSMSIRANLTLAILRKIAKAGFVRAAEESRLVSEWIRELSVKAADTNLAAETLSGGNQQKLVLGKWLATSPRVLMLDEPTRGVDVGAKAQVYQLIRELARQGTAVLVVTSDLPELLALCQRIVVIREGRIAGELDGVATTQQEVLQLALPGGEALSA